MTLCGTSSALTRAHVEGWFTKETTASLRKLHVASPPRSTLQAVVLSSPLLMGAATKVQLLSEKCLLLKDPFSLLRPAASV